MQLTKSSAIRVGTLITALAASTLLTGCAKTFQKLEAIGDQPPLTAVKDPTTEAKYQPITWPMPETQPAPRQYANSLWQPGARTFFRDGRAARVGDILKVNIKINDKAQIDNETERKRTATDTVSAPGEFAIADKLLKYIPGLPAKGAAAALTNGNGNTDNKGTGTIKRQEIITTQVAALVTQILPNGNFVIDGTSELLINYDVREIGIKGVVRPQDIASDNTVDSTQIAQARITYGGHGQLMDIQQPRWGSQAVEELAPF